jgi:hypothetical protein
MHLDAGARINAAVRVAADMRASFENEHGQAQARGRALGDGEAEKASAHYDELRLNIHVQATCIWAVGLDVQEACGSVHNGAAVIHSLGELLI